MMADGPLNTPALDARLSLCPECCGAVYNVNDGGACSRCGWRKGLQVAAGRRARALPDAQPHPAPAFNHTRSDGPFDPCPECAALMGPASREALYRDLICCLLDQMGEMMVSDGHDCETNGRFPCCRARGFLVATRGLQPEKLRPAEVPPLPAGGQIGRAP